VPRRFERVAITGELKNISEFRSRLHDGSPVDDVVNSGDCRVCDLADWSSPPRRLTRLATGSDPDFQRLPGPTDQRAEPYRGRHAPPVAEPIDVTGRTVEQSGDLMHVEKGREVADWLREHVCRGRECVGHIGYLTQIESGEPSARQCV